RWAAVPYGVLEAVLLRFVRELRPEHLAGRNGDEERLAVLEGRKSELEGNVNRTKARYRSGAIPDHALDLLDGWGAELNKVRAEREAVAGRLVAGGGEALRETHTALDALRHAPAEQRPALRERLKVQLRQLVSDVWVLVSDADKKTREAHVQ